MFLGIQPCSSGCACRPCGVHVLPISGVYSVKNWFQNTTLLPCEYKMFVRLGYQLRNYYHEIGTLQDPRAGLSLWFLSAGRLSSMVIDVHSQRDLWKIMCKLIARICSVTLSHLSGRQRLGVSSFFLLFIPNMLNKEETNETEAVLVCT